MYSTHAIEHGSSRTGRWLRERRLRVTFWIAAIEGVLYLFGVISWWAVAALAAIALLFWWYAGRAHRSDVLRQGSWVFAASQLLVLCVPIAFAVVKALAIGLVALIALAALILLFTRRP
jgi:hypothetical protein